MKQTAVRIPDNMHARLQALAAKTGRTATFYIREAIETHLEDMEDVYLAEQALEKLAKGKDKIISSEEFWQGMDD
jgi:RHH-type rel operon transcriptional repressor/antitoxin RelB